jgi:hypothetical protein
VFRTIFKPKRQEVTRRWIKLHCEIFHNVYSSANIVRLIVLRRMRLAGTCSTHGEMKNTLITLLGKAAEMT